MSKSLETHSSTISQQSAYLMQHDVVQHMLTSNNDFNYSVLRKK